jgi:hypothetical protein
LWRPTASIIAFVMRLLVGSVRSISLSLAR